MTCKIQLDHHSRRIFEMIKEEVNSKSDESEFNISPETIEKINRIYRLASSINRNKYVELSSYIIKKLHVENVFFKFKESEDNIRPSLAEIVITKKSME